MNLKNLENWRCWMLHIKKMFFMIPLMMFSSVLFAQQILSLDSVLRNIKQNNPQLKMYDEQIKSENAKIEGASAWMAPMVGVSSFMTPYNNFSRPGNQQDGSFMLMFQQAIPNSSKIKANENYLSAQSAITNEAKAEDFNEMRAMARSWYLNILTLQKMETYQTKNIAVIKNLKKLAEIRYTYNKAGLSEIYNMEAKIYDLQNKLATLQSNIRIGKIRLNTLMNRDKELDFEVDTSMNYRNKSLEIDLPNVLDNRSNVKMMDAQIKSLSLENKMIASEAKPEFNLQLNHMITYNTTRPNQFSLTGGITIPIAPWSAKSYQSKLKANDFDVAAMQLKRENLLNNLTGMIKSGEKDLIRLERELDNYETKILPNLQKSYEVYLLNYQENKADLTTVLDAWKEINDSELEYFTLLNNYYQMRTEYEKNVER